MKIVLIGKKYIYKGMLPQNNVNNYIINDKTEKNQRISINIKGENDNWVIESNNQVQVINPKFIDMKTNRILGNLSPESILNKIELQEDKSFFIKIKNISDLFILYCFSNYDNDFMHFDLINVPQLNIGYGNKNNIIYKTDLISELHTSIYKVNGLWTVENYDKNYGTFVNNYPVYDNVKTLFNGDVIFIMGLRIIIMKNSIFINNPNNSLNTDKQYFKISKKINIDEIKDLKWDENEEIDITKPINYYLKSPRMEDTIKTEELNIDRPPETYKNPDRPWLFTIGTSIAFGMMSVLSMMNTIKGISSGTSSVIEIIISLFAEAAMISAMIVLPIWERKWEKKNEEQNKKKMTKRYKEYLESKKEQIDKIREKQKRILYERYVSADECAKIVSTNSHKLWEREITDDDFLCIRLGIGRIPLDVNFNSPQESFSLEEEDKLLSEFNEVVENSLYIDEAPAIASLVKNNKLAIISKDEENIRRLIRSYILQLITFQSYDDLKLVFFMSKEKSKDWQYVKMLPHIWNNEKQIRFYADTYEEMAEVSKYLVEEINSRNQNEDKETKYKPYYLIITDDYKMIESLPIVNKVLKQEMQLGFGLLCMTDAIYKLPNQCNLFINVLDNKNALLIYDEKLSKTEMRIKLEPFSSFFFEKISKNLANTNLRLEYKGTSALPNNYSFLEMYNVGKIEQLDSLNRWKKNDSTLSLKVPVGIDSNGNLISLDAHEKYHGPHGLIAGSTGSGKSEFIITYILSLAVNYHPDDVAFLLIDYKGGGLAGAFDNNNIRLPHLVGTITNIDKAGLERSLTSIQSELRRRQVKFNEARNVTDEGTIDIYKYQKFYHDGIVKEPIPHLFIICDEFAELKQQQPDFMDELISVSRIGRSLGVHLILATQKPSGIVNDQIRSNSKFAICLKVQDTSDSRDVIQREDAAFLKKAGQFYFRVGQDEYYILGQSGWAGAYYIPSEVSKKKVDSSVEFISNIGATIKRVDNIKQKSMEIKGEQLTNVLTYICDLAKKEGIKTKNLWLDDISEDIFVKDLRNKYKIPTSENNIKAVIGEYDDPYNQKQGPVELDFMKKENVAIFGNAKSGRETLLSTMIYDLMTEYSTKRVQMYILDFGTEALKTYRNSHHIGDVIFLGEDDKVEALFKMLKQQINERKNILSNYNGDYDLYISKGNTMPYILVIINNFDVFAENYENKYDDIFLSITREALKCGISFVITANSTSSMRYRLGQNFSKRIALQLNSDDEYMMIFDNVRKMRPSNIFGRGLVTINSKQLYEFQTAKICEYSILTEHLMELIEKLNKENELKANKLPIMPKFLPVEDIQDSLIDLSTVPIGIKKDDLKIIRYNFMEKVISIISSNRIDDAVEFVSHICKEVENKGIDIITLNGEDSKKSLDELYNNFIESVKKTKKEAFFVIIGISKFIDEEVFDEDEFSEILEKAQKNKKYCFVLVDTPKHLEEFEDEDWYEEYIKENTGIWIGAGVQDQDLIDTNYSFQNPASNNLSRSFGYVIENGDYTLIKLVGMEEEGEENE